MAFGRPRIYESVEQLEEAVYDYFYPLKKFETGCGIAVGYDNDRDTNKKPSITGLALHLGFADKTTLYDYRDRPEFSHPIKWALTMIEKYHEEGLSENNVTGRIFALKNMGWKDKQEVEQSGGLTINWQEQRTYETK